MDRIRFQLATIDLDGTLLRGTAFEAVARGAGFLEPVARHDAEYLAGSITLEECFRLEYTYLVGRAVEELHRHLDSAPWIDGIPESVAMLEEAGLAVALLTDQPRFLCDYLARFGFADAICSEARVEDGRVTADVRPAFDKLASLRAFSEKRGILPSQTLHVGNDVNDVRVFGHVALGVAVNPTSERVGKSADLCFENVSDLRPVAETLVEAIGEDENPS